MNFDGLRIWIKVAIYIKDVKDFPAKFLKTKNIILNRKLKNVFK